MRATIEQVRTAILATEKAVAALGLHLQQPELVPISGLPFHRHLYYDDLLLSYLKCVRAVSSLNACLVLLESGYVFEVHALCRSIDECSEDVFFFAKPDGENGAASANQERALNEFYQEEWTDLDNLLGSQQPRDRVPRQKVHARMARLEGPGMNPSDLQALQGAIHQTFSGFIHSAYVHIMELFGGKGRGFHLRGMLGTPRMDECLESLASCAYRAMVAAEVVAGRCHAEQIYSELKNARQRFFADAELGVKGDPAVLMAELKGKGRAT